MTALRLQAKLHHLALASPAPQKLAAFYQRAFGLDLTRDGQAWRGVGRERRLTFLQGEAKTLVCVTYAVPDAGEIDALKIRCAAHGARVSDHADFFLKPGAICVRDPDGNMFAFGLARDDTPAHGLAARLQHVVVASTDAAKLAAFYCQCLGFSVSDNVVDEHGTLRTAFLRCSEEHHSLAVFQAAKCWFDHHCYEAGDWGLIRDWGDHFARLDIPVQWGPGRHGPGNNLFLFIHDPDGNWVEISAELEIVAPDRPVGVWKHEQKTLNSWGSAPLRS